MDDVTLNKAATIERCVQRVREEYGADPRNLRENLTKQDSIVLNVQRGCEAAIDLAMHLVRKLHLGVPQDSRDAFEFLAKASEIEPALRDSLKAMVGFRNVAVHDYQVLSIDILQSVVERRLDDLLAFASIAVRRHG